MRERKNGTFQFVIANIKKCRLLIHLISKPMLKNSMLHEKFLTHEYMYNFDRVMQIVHLRRTINHYAIHDG